MARRAEPVPFPPYVPSQRCLGPCRQCGALVIGRRFMDGQYLEQVPRLSPVLGTEHQCQPPTEEPVHE